MQIFLSVKKIVLLLKFGPRGVGVGGGGGCDLRIIQVWLKERVVV